MKARLNQRIPNLKLKICACGGCYSASGYIRVEPTHWQEISELAGSAETGGEKCGAYKEYDGVGCSLPIGHEGNHKSANASEPEKLNNAHNAWPPTITLSHGAPPAGSSPIGALAESSLSSPPPKCPECKAALGTHHVEPCRFWGQVLPSECSPELLPTQLPKEK
jgi:hypothetical protein